MQKVLVPHWEKQCYVFLTVKSVSTFDLFEHLNHGEHENEIHELEHIANIGSLDMGQGGLTPVLPLTRGKCKNDKNCPLFCAD